MLALLFWLLPFQAIVATVKAIPVWVFASVFALFLLAHVAGAFKWWMLLGRVFPLFLAVRAHFAGLAANLCLPGAIGGDAVRAGLVYATIRDGSRVMVVAAADRLIDMIALLTVSVLGLAISQSDGANGSLIFQVAALLGLVLVGAFLLPKLLPLVWQLAPGLPGRSFGERIAADFAALTKRPLTLITALVMSIAVQTLLVVLAFWLAASAGVGVELGHWMFAWPLAKIIAVLPVSLNGLGLREATLAAFLAPFGADPAGVVAAGLVWQAILFAGGGAGALVLALSGAPASGKLVDGKEVTK